ncbi:MAG: PqqD family protein [Rhodospirillales bacterium]
MSLDRGRDSGRSGMLVRELGDEILVLDVEGEQVHQLNTSASRVWRLYDDGASVEGIVEKLVAEFDVNKERAHHDVLDVLSQFRALSLIK